MDNLFLVSPYILKKLPTIDSRNFGVLLADMKTLQLYSYASDRTRKRWRIHSFMVLSFLQLCVI
ncbi:MAG: hypothetical protein ACYTXA_14815 [Nostoc sp.]